MDGTLSVEEVGGGVAVLTLRGEHDVGTASELRDLLGRLVEEHDGVVIDLDATAFIDSSILGAIMGGLRRSKESGRGFALVLNDDVAPTVGRLFQLTGLRLVFSIHGSREEAIAAASSQRVP